MRNITLTKVAVQDFEVIQAALLQFIVDKNAGLIPIRHTDRYFSDVLFIDVAQKLYNTFRNKIEKATKTVASLTVATSEAVVLLQCCSDAQAAAADYDLFALRQMTDRLYSELINLSNIVQPSKLVPHENTHV